MERTDLSIDVERIGDDTVVLLCGDLDIESAALLRERIDGLPLSGSVVLDLAGLTFLDSTGIGCFFKMHQRVEDLGGFLVARGAPPAIRQALQTAQVSRVIAVLD